MLTLLPGNWLETRRNDKRQEEWVLLRIELLDAAPSSDSFKSRVLVDPGNGCFNKEGLAFVWRRFHSQSKRS